MATASRSAWMNAWENDLVPSDAALRSAARVTARTRYTRYYGREATARLPQPEPEVLRTEAPPELKVVTRRRPRWGAILVALAFAGLLLGVSVVVPMLVSATATSVEQAVGELEAREQALTTAASTLSARISTLSSPKRVTEQAIQLGLGPAQSVHYLQAGTGTAASGGDTTVAGR
jgi:cell division protein FtsL